MDAIDEPLCDRYWRDVLASCDDRHVLQRDPQALTHEEAIEFLAALQVQRSVIDGLEARALVAAAGIHRQVREVVVLDEFTDDERSFDLVDERREEIAVAVKRTPAAVDRQILIARVLVGWLRPTLDGLEAGRITGAHANVIAEQALTLSTSGPCVNQAPDQDSPDEALDRIEFAHACDRLQERVLKRAARLTPAETRRLARRVIARIDSAGQHKRRARAKSQCDVVAYGESDGLAVLHARMTTEQAARVYAAIDARARTYLQSRVEGSAQIEGQHCTQGESSDDSSDITIGQARVQALVDAVCGVSDGTKLTSNVATKVVTEIQVLVGLDTLLGLSDEPGSITLGGRAPETVIAAAVRELLADESIPTSLRRLVTDPVSGQLLDRGRSSYEVTPRLRAFLVARDATCRFPGCARAAPSCQVDHAVAWNDGGVTDRANLGHLSARHHQLKTHGGWDILHSRDDGSVVWRSPHGRTMSVHAPPVV